MRARKLKVTWRKTKYYILYITITNQTIHRTCKIYKQHFYIYLRVITSSNCYACTIVLSGMTSHYVVDQSMINICDLNKNVRR